MSSPTLLGSTAMVKVTAGHIRELEKEALNPREAVLEHLKRYEDVQHFQIGGDSKVRIAPQVIANIYKSGRSAVR